jgi:putative transposase
MGRVQVGSGIDRIYRLYREEDLTLRKRRANREDVRTRAPILIEARVNRRHLFWLACKSLPGSGFGCYVRDQTAGGQRLRAFNVVDDASRDCVATIPGRRFGGFRLGS